MVGSGGIMNICLCPVSTRCRVCILFSFVFGLSSLLLFSALLFPLRPSFFRYGANIFTMWSLLPRCWRGEPVWRARSVA